MPAINIFAKRADYISGKERSDQWAETGNNYSVHRGESFNIDMGTFVNRLWLSYHHKPSETGKLANGLDDWLDGAGRHTHGSEVASRFIYGNWNTMNLKGAYGWALVAMQPYLAEKLRLHLRNYHTILALSAGWAKRPGDKGGKPVYPSVICGNRSFVTDREDKKYFDSRGRYLPSANMDGTAVDYHLAHELGLAAPVGPYADQVHAFQKVASRTWRSLSIEEVGDLNRIIRSPELFQDTVKRVVTYLKDGPYFQSGIEILKTTEGVAFVINNTKGGSTSPLEAMIWTENPNAADGPWKMLDWWDIDPRFGWLNASSPMRKNGKDGKGRIHRQHPSLWSIEAITKKGGEHFDVVEKKYRPGAAFAQIGGTLLYHLKWSSAGTSVEFPGGVWVPGQGGGTDPGLDKPSESCWDKLTFWR